MSSISRSKNVNINKTKGRYIYYRCLLEIDATFHNYMLSDNPNGYLYFTLRPITIISCKYNCKTIVVKIYTELIGMLFLVKI